MRFLLGLILSLYVGAVGAAIGTMGGRSPDPRVQVSLSTYGATCDGVANDTAAFLAFKAAYQGATPVQLNLPGFCTFLPTGGAGGFPFSGVKDLIVAGNGTATSGMKNIAVSNNWIFGGGGQGNNNSLPTDTANAGDSCVILKTAPSITISGAAPTIPRTATFTASASGTTLTVASVASGTLVAGMQIRPLSADSRSFIIIASQINGTPGGAGDYTLTASFSSGSTTFVSAPASFTASVDTTGLMNVSAVADGVITVGAMVFSADAKYGGTGTQIGQGITTIKSQVSGAAGGVGTYQLDNITAVGGSGNSPVAAPSQAFHTAGQIRLTVNSTTGLTSGDTLFISGVTGTNQFANRVNGLKWIKVVDGTHIDLFQFSFDEGSYTSGGVAGGDRTSLTPVGSIVLMTGYTLQSYWGAPYGFPSNPHWFEWLKVASVNPSTHQVCFTTPLVNTYKDTWPRYNTGNGVLQVDPGGPATMYPIPDSWDLTHVYKDFTIDNPSFQTAAGGRNITWNNVGVVGSHCMIPSQNETYTWINIDGSACDIETDKMVGTWNITNSALKILTFQSSSVDLVNVTNSTIKSWAGGGKRTIFDNTSFNCTGCPATTASLSAGATAYGSSDELVCTDCTVVNLLGATGPIQRVDLQPWSMSSGVITIPNAFSFHACCNLSELQVRGIVPGHYIVWRGAGRASGPFTQAQNGRVFKVTDVTQDLDNTYVHTSEAGGFPTGDWTFNGLSVQPHPAPKLTVSFLPGSGEGALWFNGCPAQDPMFSCANYTRTGGASGTTPQGGPTLWGELDTFTFTNNVPYTGAGTLNWNAAQFTTIPYLKIDNTQTLVNFGINMKLPASCGSCTRTYTASGAANSQVGDSFPTVPPAGAVFGAAFALSVFSANTPSDSPQMTVTLRTNQNLP